MNVGELIEKLKQMPQDALVVIEMCSECRALDDDEPTLGEDFIERNGTYFKYKSIWWDADKDGSAKRITVCHFPGN